jgi:hypothetical protein
MEDQHPAVDGRGEAYSRVLGTCGAFGIGLVVLFGLLYLVGVNPRYDAATVTRYWDRPAGEYWIQVKGSEAVGYSWFASDPGTTDSLTMFGIGFISLVPLFGTIAMVFRAEPLHRFLLALLAAEFIYAILRPII